MSKSRIISFLNKHYLSKNVSFGDIIHKLKPPNISFWSQYLADNNWFLTSDLTKHGFNEYDLKQWIYYLKHSFWKLYVSETKAIRFFDANFGIKLTKCSKTLDFKYGVDFKFDKNNFLIVKSSLKGSEINTLIEYKQLKYFSYRQYNLTNSKIYVYISNNDNLYLYEYISNNLKLVLAPISK